MGQVAQENKRRNAKLGEKKTTHIEEGESKRAKKIYVQMTFTPVRHLTIVLTHTQKK